MTIAAGKYDSSTENRTWVMSPEMSHGMYDGTSSESSASSPMNCNGFENVYVGTSYLAYPTFPMQYPTQGEGLAAPIGLIPVELDIEGLYEDHDRRRRKNGTEKTVSSHIHSRRRAQNRASQRAFRDRKEKHMRDLEHRLSELEGRHADISRSYESLQLEYSSVKQELETLRKEKARLDKGTSSQPSESRSHNSKPWEESKGEILDPLLFDVSAFCFDHDEGEDRKV